MSPPDPELPRDLAALEQDVAFLARLLRLYPERATLGRLGLRPVDFAYREALGALVASAGPKPKSRGRPRRWP